MDFSQYLAKNGVTMADFMDKERAPALVERFAKDLQVLWAMINAEEVKAEKATAENAPKELPAYEKAWAANKEAAALAQTIIDKMIATVETIENDAATVYHVKSLLRTGLLPYVANEVLYQESLEEDKTPKVTTVASSAKAEMVATFRNVTTDLNRIVGLLYPTWPVKPRPEYVKTDGKDPVINVKGIRGNFGGSSNGAATGRAAALYGLTFTVKDVTYDDPKVAMRHILKGMDRASMKVTQFMDLVETKVGKDIYSTTTARPFVYKGVKVIVDRKKEGS